MKIKVTENRVKIDNEILNDSEYRIHECEFELPESFNGLVQKAVFTWEEDTPIRMDIVNGKCDIPIEVLHDGILKIGVYAFETVNDKLELRYSPSADTIRVYEGSYVANAQNSEGGTPSEFEQLESRVNTALNQIDEALDDVETAVDEANNLNMDVNKSGKTATVTLTKKDSTKKVVTLSDGTSLMFNWDGTRLGIKTDEDAEYTYVDLQGVQGPIGPKGEAFTIKKTYTSVAEMNADFNNMQVGDYVMIASTVEIEDNAKLYTRGETQWIFISDFSGATGIRGETGLTPNIQIGTVISGATPNVTRTGTNENPILNFTLVKGDTGATGPQGETGATGNGILSIQKTATQGLVDTYTITFTDGTTTTFDVTNGEDGEVTQEQLDETNENVDWLQTLVNQMPTVSGQGTDLSLQDVLNYRLMKFLSQGVSSQFSTEGKQLFNKLTVIAGALQANGTVNASATLMVSDYIEIDSTKQYYKTESGSIRVKLYDENKIVISTSSNSDINGFSAEGVYSIPFANAKYIRISITNELVDTLMFAQSDTATSYEPYTGGVPAPNPSYPYPIKSVTGENSLKISNSNNTETQSYSISLGNIELNSSPDGTIRDGIIGTPNNWFKREYIGKIVLNGSENWGASSTYTNETIYSLYLALTNYKNNSQFISDLFTYQNITPSTTTEYIATGGDSIRIGILKSRLNAYTVNDFKQWLSAHNTTVWYQKSQYTDIPITDTTLINQLNDIYNNAHSYNGVTNITTTYADGNEQMYLDIEALKNVWSEV